MFRLYDYLIFVAAFVSFLLSVGLWFSGYREEGAFVGIWVPSILGIGIYGKLIRIVHFVLYKKLGDRDSNWIHIKYLLPDAV